VTAARPSPAYGESRTREPSHSHLERPRPTSQSDHYQARHYHAWYRHITLSMAAHTCLAAAAASKKGTQPLWTASAPANVPGQVLSWSHWRRRRQARARRSHYRRRGHPPP
jgi:hypothetical protein